MDPRVKKAYSGKLSALRQEKRIDSPLVRYNDLDQPVCRVCNVLLKSESSWPAHQISRKHQEAVNNLKARVARAPDDASVSAVKSSSAVVDEIPRARPSSSLPEGFFDKQETKRPNTGSKNDPVAPTSAAKSVDVKSRSGGNRASLLSNKAPVLDQNGNKVALISEYSMLSYEEDEAVALGRSDANEGKGGMPSKQLGTVSRTINSVKQAKGALPSGFFDDKDADLRAHGIQPVKVDIKDEYKEFQKQIQEDLQDFDERLQEEEFDAAEWREAMDSLEQKSYVEKVEMFKKNLEERRATKPKTEHKRPVFMAAEPSDESSSDKEDEEEENFAVDWRAKHL